MASIGTKSKDAATKAAKGKRTGGSESGADKAKRAIKNRLK